MFDIKQNPAARLLVIVGALVATLPALARDDLGNGWAPSPLEIAQSPTYCHKQLINRDAKAIYEEFTGCEGIHHMCPGLILIDRAGNPSIPKIERRRILDQAKNEIGYVSTRLKPTCTAAPVIQAAELRIRLLGTLLK